MIRATLRFGLSILIVNCFAATWCGARTFVASPVLKGPTLPLPPLQHADWSAPTADVPAGLLTATTRLFQQGLADPRGCDYRTISVGTGSCWSGDAGVVECHGWVLPAADKAAQQFAVCWNGLVYPVVSVGDKADFKADIRALVKADDDARQRGRKATRTFHSCDLAPAARAKAQSVSEKAMLPLKVCMLLRLGEGELAARFWKSWTGPRAKNAEQHDVYVELSAALKWAMFDRARSAPICGATIA